MLIFARICCNLSICPDKYLILFLAPIKSVLASKFWSHNLFLYTFILASACISECFPDAELNFVMSYCVTFNSTSVKLRDFIFWGIGGITVFRAMEIFHYSWNTPVMSMLGADWQGCFHIFILNIGIWVGDT